MYKFFKPDNDVKNESQSLGRETNREGRMKRRDFLKKGTLVAGLTSVEFLIVTA